jgi:hypothetical protein
LGDGEFVDREAFEKLPQDTQDIGKRVGLNAMQTSIDKHQQSYNELVEALKPYTDTDGKINLANAIREGVDANKLISEGLFTRDIIDNAKEVGVALDKVEPYASVTDGKKVYDLSKYLKENPQDTETLSSVFTPESIAKAQSLNTALGKLEAYKTTGKDEDGKEYTSYDIAKFLKENPTDTETLSSVFTPESIAKAQDYNVALGKIGVYASKDEEGNVAYNLIEYLKNNPYDINTLKSIGFADNDVKLALDASVSYKVEWNQSLNSKFQTLRKGGLQ